MNKGIVFTSAGVAELIDEAMPTPAADEVVIKVQVSTISAGTERANLTGDTNISIADKATEAVFPRYGGYSSSGYVTAVGDAVTSVKPGDRVICSWGRHRQFNCVKETNVCKIPDTVSFEEAALWHIATFPLAAMRKCRLELGEPAIVMGQGILGQIAVKLLKAAGAAPIIVADLDETKRADALKIGADYAFDPRRPDFAKQVKAVTGGGVQVAIEVTGFGEALDNVLDCMARFGRVALLGCTRNSDFTIDYYRKIHGPGITLIGAHTLARPQHESHGGWWTQRDDLAALTRLHECGRLALADMVQETHSPEKAPEVYTRLAAGGAFPLVQFDWRGLK